ncbi:unnamed protein product [Closterium sp. Naga37s-1]|nr:unnamed protein product [Closterium sp. Naga37s-1]
MALNCQPNSQLNPAQQTLGPVRRSPLPTIPPSSLPLIRHRLSLQSRCPLFLSPRGRLPPIPPSPLPLIRRRISLLPAIASPSHPDVATPVVASPSHPAVASPSHPVLASPSHSVVGACA